MSSIISVNFTEEEAQLLEALAKKFLEETFEEKEKTGENPEINARIRLATGAYYNFVAVRQAKRFEDNKERWLDPEKPHFTKEYYLTTTCVIPRRCLENQGLV